MNSVLGDPPLIESLRGVRMILVRSHTLPPATHTNCFLLGDDGAHRVLVDPSPCSTAEMERLLARVAELGRKGVSSLVRATLRALRDGFEDLDGEAPLAGQPITEYAGTSDIADTYRDLAKEVLALV